MSNPTEVVFVHGFNMSYAESDGYAQTVFKRLWQLGYKGRFASLRWPTYGSGGAFGSFGTYNDSEYVAWNSAAALAVFVNGIGGNYSVNIIAHSMGNRLSKQQNNSLVGGTFNSLNQLTSLTGGSGKLQFSGTVNKTSLVTIVSGTNSYPATALWGSNFSASIPALLGTNTFSVVAQDENTNRVTNRYQIAVGALEGNRSFSYDANGNLLNDGQRTYQWDAENRLISVTQGTNTYTFGYDYASRRISEQVNGTMIKQSVWDGQSLAEERNASGAVTKQFFAQGETQNGTPYYYLRDHLGGVRELVNASGNVVAEMTYDLYGVATQWSESITPTMQYGGYYAHQGTGLNLTLYRAYDPVTSRWISRDPIGEKGGINLYGYVRENPVRRIDPLGLCNDGEMHLDEVLIQATSPSDEVVTQAKGIIQKLGPEGQEINDSLDIAQYGGVAAQEMLTN